MKTLLDIATAHNITFETNIARVQAQILFENMALRQQLDAESFLVIFKSANDSTPEGQALLKKMVWYVEKLSNHTTEGQEGLSLKVTRDLITQLACENYATAEIIITGTLGTKYFKQPYEASESTNGNMAIKKEIFSCLLTLFTKQPEILDKLYRETVTKTAWSFFMRAMKAFIQDFPREVASLLGQFDRCHEDVKYYFESNFAHQPINKDVLFENEEYLRVCINSERISAWVLEQLLRHKYQSHPQPNYPQISELFVFEIAERWPKWIGLLFPIRDTSRFVDNDSWWNFLSESKEAKTRVKTKILPLLIAQANNGVYAAKQALALIYFSGYTSEEEFKEIGEEETVFEENTENNELQQALSLLQENWEASGKEEELCTEADLYKESTRTLLNFCGESFAKGELKGPYAKLGSRIIYRSYKTAASCFEVTDNQEWLTKPSFLLELCRELQEEGDLAAAFNFINQAKSPDTKVQPTHMNKVKRAPRIFEYRIKEYTFYKCLILRARLIQDIIGMAADRSFGKENSAEYYASKVKDLHQALFILANLELERKDYLTSASLLHLAAKENAVVYESSICYEIALKLIEIGHAKEGCYLLKQITDKNDRYVMAQNFLKIIVLEVKEEAVSEIKTSSINMTRAIQLRLCKPAFETVIAAGEVLLTKFTGYLMDSLKKDLDELRTVFSNIAHELNGLEGKIRGEENKVGASKITLGFGSAYKEEVVQTPCAGNGITNQPS